MTSKNSQMDLNNRTVSKMLIIGTTLTMLFCYIKADDSKYSYPVLQRVDDLQEWIKLGPRPLMDIKYISGDKELFVSSLNH